MPEVPDEYGNTVVYDKDVTIDGVPVGPDVDVALTKVPMAELELERGVKVDEDDKLPVPVGKTTLVELLNGYKTEVD